MFEKEAEEIVKRNVCGDCNKCQSYGYIGCDIYRYSKDSCLYGLRTGYNKAMKEWRDCFMSCSSPYCADKFRDIQCNGMLGNMTKEVRDGSVE